MRLYFIRHGESEANILQEISNRGHKHGLTEKGRLQVFSMAQRLASTPFARLYSSPLLRAVQSAEILSDKLSIPFEITDALREFDCGIIEGKSDPQSWQIHVETRQAWFLHKEWDRKIEGGESFLDIQARFRPFIDSLIKEYHKTQENLLLLGHGGLFQCILPLICRNIDIDHVLELPLRNMGIIIVEHRPVGLICLEWDGLIMAV